MTHYRDWFRKSTWSAKDQVDFEAKLSRALPRRRAQLLRIQAGHLLSAAVGKRRKQLVVAAMALLNQMFKEYPDDIQAAQAHLSLAEGHCILGDYKEAESSFRQAIRQERAFPNVLANAPLEFAWFIVKERRRHLYREALRHLAAWKRDYDIGLNFPSDRFQYNAIKAVALNSMRQYSKAGSHAETALDALGATNSGLRYHPEVGLVEDCPAWIPRELQRIRRRLSH